MVRFFFRITGKGNKAIAFRKRIGWNRISVFITANHGVFGNKFACLIVTDGFYREIIANLYNCFFAFCLLCKFAAVFPFVGSFCFLYLRNFKYAVSVRILRRCYNSFLFFDIFSCKDICLVVLFFVSRNPDIGKIHFVSADVGVFSAKKFVGVAFLTDREAGCFSCIGQIFFCKIAFDWVKDLLTN